MRECASCLEPWAWGPPAPRRPHPYGHAGTVRKRRASGALAARRVRIVDPHAGPRDWAGPLRGRRRSRLVSRRGLRVLTALRRGKVIAHADRELELAHEHAPDRAGGLAGARVTVAEGDGPVHGVRCILVELCLLCLVRGHQQHHETRTESQSQQTHYAHSVLSYALRAAPASPAGAPMGFL